MIIYFLNEFSNILQAFLNKKFDLGIFVECFISNHTSLIFFNKKFMNLFFFFISPAMISVGYLSVFLTFVIYYFPAAILVVKIYIFVFLLLFSWIHFLVYLAKSDSVIRRFTSVNICDHGRCFKFIIDWRSQRWNYDWYYVHFHWSFNHNFISKNRCFIKKQQKELRSFFFISL